MIKKTRILIMLVFILLIVLFINTTSSSHTYIRPLENGYYIICDEESGDRLKNSRDDYIYQSNFPKEEITHILERENIVLLKCLLDERKDVYYIIDTSTDEITGPMGEENFVIEISKNLEISYLNWITGFN